MAWKHNSISYFLLAGVCVGTELAIIQVNTKEPVKAGTSE